MVLKCSLILRGLNSWCHSLLVKIQTPQPDPTVPRHCLARSRPDACAPHHHWPSPAPLPAPCSSQQRQAPRRRRGTTMPQGRSVITSSNCCAQHTVASAGSCQGRVPCCESLPSWTIAALHREICALQSTPRMKKLVPLPPAASGFRPAVAREGGGRQWRWVGGSKVN